MSARKTTSKEHKTDTAVRDLFQLAAPKAAQTLIDALDEENLKRETRLDCAKEILNRVYGKSVLLNENDNEIRIVLGKEFKEFAK